MDSIKISLAIFGNQNSNSGFQPLYWINDPPQQLENIVPPGMDENSYFFTLQILPAHTQYTLIHNRVSSYMSARPGVLKMAVALPKGYRISSDVSPMQVLLEVRKTFLETCMTLRDAHAEAYNFKEKLVDPDIFANIVDAYHLVPDSQPHLPMTGEDDALMLLDDATIAQLFIAPQRQEFTRFRRIVIANKGNAAVYKSAIEYPTTDETVTVRAEKKEISREDTSVLKPFSWKKYMPALICPLLIGGAVYWTLNSSRPPSAGLTDEDDATQNQNDDATQERMEQEIMEAYVIASEPPDSMPPSADTPYRQEQPPQHAPDKAKNMNHK